MNEPDGGTAEDGGGGEAGKDVEMNDISASLRHQKTLLRYKLKLVLLTWIPDFLLDLGWLLLVIIGAIEILKC